MLANRVLDLGGKLSKSHSLVFLVVNATHVVCGAIWHARRLDLGDDGGSGVGGVGNVGGGGSDGAGDGGGVVDGSGLGAINNMGGASV